MKPGIFITGTDTGVILAVACIRFVRHSNFPQGFEECVAKCAVRLGRSIQVLDSLIERNGIEDILLDYRPTYPLDHRRECLSRESIDQFRLAGIDIHHSRGYPDFAIARSNQQGIQRPSNQRVSTRAGL